jgi:DNA-binding MarR family transcriptional regulator
MDAPPKAPFLDDYLLYLLARASHTVSAEFHARLKRQGVAVAEWRVLATLSGRPFESITRLSAACLMQQPTMTRLLDRMARDGLVHRLPDPADRRATRVALTEAGRELAERLVAAARAHEAEVLARHPGTEALIKAILRDLIGERALPSRALPPRA